MLSFFFFYLTHFVVRFAFLYELSNLNISVKFKLFGKKGHET